MVPSPEVAIASVQDKVQGGLLTDARSLDLDGGLVKALAQASRTA